MKTLKKLSPFTVGALCLALFLGQVGPASAAPNDKALKALQAVSPSFQSESHRTTKVKVPADSSGVVTITGQKGQTLSLGLPFGEISAPAEPIGSGLVSYDNGNGSATVPVPQEDNSVAIHTIIESSTAPSRYAYRVESPVGTKMTLNEDGSVAITRADGTFFGGFAKPWAKDATGVDLPTHYEIDKKQLVQVIDHSTQGVVYPVVADPYAGVDLIDGLPWITYTSQGGVANLNPTGWGRFYNGFATHNAHVDELRAKLL